MVQAWIRQFIKQSLPLLPSFGLGEDNGLWEHSAISHTRPTSIQSLFPQFQHEFW